MSGTDKFQHLSPWRNSNWMWLKSLRENYVYNDRIKVQVPPNLSDKLGVGFCAILDEDERLGRLRQAGEFFRQRWQICLLFYR